MSDKNSTVCPTMIGGQALIEGVMMKGPGKIAAVVRKSDGTHVVKETKVKTDKEKFWLSRLPVIRGFMLLGSMLKSGYGLITWSAENTDMYDDLESSKFDLWLEKHISPEKLEKVMLAIAMVFGIAVPIVLFIFLPTLIAGFLDGFVSSFILRNLIEGAIRVLIFVLFIWGTSLMKDMRRVYMYHGAEHKTIHCYESGQELTVENAQKFSTHHPRCGTSFLFVVMIISILIFSFVSWSNPFMRMALRLALMPLVAGISYEINRFVGRYDNVITRALRAPGMAMQNFTTKEPEDYMVAVAIDAFERVRPEDKQSGKW